MVSVEKSPQERLSELFGSYKAEWLKDRMYELFTEPAYFPELTTNRPCILIGGRGTGKTTVLRCLSYQGQYKLNEKRLSKIDSWPYYGIYYRVNTNRVTAFDAPEIEEGRWIKYFAHYINLLLCKRLVGFLLWYKEKVPGLATLEEKDTKLISVALNCGECSTIEDLAAQIELSYITFQSYINNIGDKEAKSPQLSLQGTPIDTLIKRIYRLPQFENKQFFFLVDEYENLLDYQQRIFNTLIKHCGDLYTFKVGVRELGLRCRTTLNENEQLISPADYVRIDIAEKLSDITFTKFASDVCYERIKQLSWKEDNAPTIKELLPGISEEKEAELLDKKGKGVAHIYSNKLSKVVKKEDKSIYDSMSLLKKYFLVFWAKNKSKQLLDVWNEYLSKQDEYDNRYDNYKHALLYTLVQGKTGITKYYCGWEVFAKLAAGNIRYFLELVDQSLMLQINNTQELSYPILENLQTKAAQAVGKKNLSELEGLSVHGANLTKLLLGMGRVFQVMASELIGHSPEVNQFHVKEENESINLTDVPANEGNEIEEILKGAVMHLALIRSTGNKLADEADTKAYDYMMHPIFTPFFVFSYRRKRKMILAGSDILGLIKSPKTTIRKILRDQNREPEQSLPDQLELFKAYYNAN